MPSVQRLATDITCVERMGLEAWLAGPAWPVSEDEFHALSDFLIATWMEICEAMDAEDRDVAYCEWPAGWLLRVAHAAVVARLADRSDLELLLGDLSRPMFAPDWEALGQAHSRMLSQGRGRLAMRRLARNAAFNRHLSPWSRLACLVRPDATALGSNDALRESHVRSVGLGVDNTYVGLLAAGAERGAEPGPGLRRAAASYVDAVGAELDARFGADLDRRAVRGVLDRRLGTLLAVHRAVRRRAGSRPLLVTEAGKPLHMTAACGWRAGGGRTVGYHHGSFTGEFHHGARAYRKFYAYDEYICPTEAASRALEADYSALVTNRNGDSPSVRFSVCGAGIGVSSSQAGLRDDFPGRVRRVMIMGFPMNTMRYAGVRGQFWPVQFELEVRLVRLLMGAGFEVLYKVHPERAHPASELMAELGCRVVPERFEQVVDQADAFVVKYINSSTFATVVRSARPVFLIDLEREAWRPERRDLLARRCVMLPGEIGPDGRVAFDEQALLDGLSRDQEFPDYGYVTENYTPREAR